MYPSRRPGASRSARTAAIAPTLAALLLAAACSSGGDPSFQPGADSGAAPIGGSEPGAPSSDSGAFEERTISVDQALEVADTLDIGGTGTGTLNITGGGTVSNTLGHIGLKEE